MQAGRISARLFFGNALLLALVLIVGILFHSLRIGALRDSAIAQAAAVDAATLALLVEQSTQEPDWSHVFAAFADRDVRMVRSDANGRTVAVYGTAHDAESERMAEPELLRLAEEPRVSARRVISGTRWSIEARRCGTAVAPAGAVWVAHRHPALPLIDAPALAMIFAVALLMALVNLSVAVSVARRHAAPLHAMSEAARRIAAGDAGVRADALQPGDLGVLARSLNDIRDRLAASFSTIDRHQLTLEALLNQLNEGIVVTRADGRVALVNATALRMLNVTGAATPTAADCQRLIGAALERVVPRRDLQELLRFTPETQGEAAAGAGGGADNRIQVDQPGGERHLLARASNILLPAGGRQEPGQRERGRLLLLTDITELARTVQIKTDFVANASHELRTPLTAIRSAIEALLEMDLTQEREYAQKFLRMIDRHSARLIALVSDLLDLSRIESPARSFEAQRMDWLNVSRDLYERFEDRILAKRLQWDCRVPEGAPRAFRASAYLLSLVLDNLVDNAIKFTPEGGRITITFHRDDRNATIEVIDSGCGIAPEHQRRVFERFYQVERARSGSERGTGLGLSIVRHAVTAMRGTIELTSQPGIGTRFVLRIPQDAPSNDAEVQYPA